MSASNGQGAEMKVEQSVPVEEAGNTVPPSGVTTIWDYEDFRKSFVRLVDALVPFIERKLDREHGTARWAMKWMLIANCGVVAGIAGAVVWLTHEGKMSADAATFVFGVLIGTAFTSLRGFFPKL
ncbi:MAG: hypothetical protein M1343_13915 [Chloroflexi bacterium]|nr:hypothetical protein [Chloroflexota bacterium]MDA8189305.1 hypothetical protein [Dehalococcoidales bacterium]